MRKTRTQIIFPFECMLMSFYVFFKKPKNRHEESRENIFNKISSNESVVAPSFLAVYLWAIYLTTSSLSFLICNNKTGAIPPLRAVMLIMFRI